MNEDLHQPNTPQLAGYASGTFLGFGALVAWLIYDLVVFVASALAVMDSGRRVARGEWAIVGGIAVLPLTLLCATALIRYRRREFLPTTFAGRAVLSAQAVGVLGLGAAIAVPVIALWSYFNPHAELVVDNRTPYTALITINADQYGMCSQLDGVEPATTKKVRVVYTDMNCWGHKPIDVEVLNALGKWDCEWTVVKTHEPMIITEESPGCGESTYRPGILRQPTSTTNGPPFSPPPR